MNETHKYHLTLDGIKEISHYFNNLELLYKLLDVTKDYSMNFLLRTFISEYSEFIVEKTEEIARVKTNAFDATCIFDGVDKADAFKKAKLLMNMINDAAFDKKFSFVDEKYKHEPIKNDNDKKVKNDKVDVTSILKNIDVDKVKNLMKSNDKAELTEDFIRCLCKDYATAEFNTREEEKAKNNAKCSQKTDLPIEEKVMKTLKDLMHLTDKEAEAIDAKDVLKLIGKKK